MNDHEAEPHFSNFEMISYMVMNIGPSIQVITSCTIEYLNGRYLIYSMKRYDRREKNNNRV